ncbi:45b1c1b1-527a-4efc-accb-88a6c11f8c50 [Thermothielavioides terrestris]|uniref:45b1c1b1-527a-4efc-accb-88a6c11f8c50 n=1 Tax=Thermothielavioides terrestris TaxID=2587410 RepID=A0A3S4AZB7_9PEZI|nr:45b1c1b1-527a-4efc-accb-88a6c11f8c50 [Thermothielavioides terrestris]
MAGKGSFQ